MDYTKGLSKYFQDRFTKLGGKVLLNDIYMTEDKDFSALVSRLKANGDAQALFARSPPLHTRQEAAYARAYPRARRQAARETGLPLALFPQACPWTPEQVLDADFWPDA